jgi:hypothetical protein
MKIIIPYTHLELLIIALLLISTFLACCDLAEICLLFLALYAVLLIAAWLIERRTGWKQLDLLGWIIALVATFVITIARM